LLAVFKEGESELLDHHYLPVNVSFPCQGKAGKG
jgi:hypothetical protein